MAITFIRKLSFVLCIGLNITARVLAQQDTSSTHFGFSVTPQLSFPVFESTELQKYEPGFGYVIGGDLYLDLSNRFQLKTGLNFQKTNLIFRDYSPFFPDDVMNGEADVYKSYWDFNYVNTFIGLPLEGKFKLAQPEASNHFFVTTGLIMRYLLSSSGDIQLVESGKVFHHYDPDQFLFSGPETWFYFSLGLGYEFKVGKGKCLIHPVYEYSPTKILEEDASAIGNGNPAFLGIRLAYY